MTFKVLLCYTTSLFHCPIDHSLSLTYYRLSSLLSSSSHFYFKINLHRCSSSSLCLFLLSFLLVLISATQNVYVYYLNAATKSSIQAFSVSPIYILLCCNLADVIFGIILSVKTILSDLVG